MVVDNEQADCGQRGFVMISHGQADCGQGCGGDRQWVDRQWAEGV